MVHGALGACEHRVVVAHHHGAAAVRVEEVAVDDAVARDHAVGRGALDEIVNGAAPALGGNEQGSVFHEGIRLHEILKVLPGGALSRLAASGHGVRAMLIEPEAVPFDDFGEVRANVVKIEVRFRRFPLRRHLCRGEGRQHGALQHRVSGLAVKAGDEARLGRANLVLHLHGVHHAEEGALGHCVPLRHGPAHHRALHGRREGDVAGAQGHGCHGLRRVLLSAGGGLQAFRGGDERLGIAFHIGGVDAVFLHGGIPEQSPKERQGAFDAPKVEAAEGSFELAQGLGIAARGAEGDDLGQQGVVAGGGAKPHLAPAVDPHPRTRGRGVGRERAPLGLDVPVPVEGFQIDPGLGRKTPIGWRLAEAKAS